MQRPPHQFHRIALRRPGRQWVQMDASARILYVFLDLFAGVARVVVCCQVQLPMATIGSAQLIEQLDEQLVVLAFSPHPVKSARSEIERPGDPHLVVGARGFQRALVAFAHPEHKPTLGLVSSLVSSWKNDPASLTIETTSKSLLCFCSR